MIRSRSTIPNLLGQAPRAIDTRHKSFKAMEWEAFLVRDGIALLCHLGPEFRPYLENFKLLRDIYVQAKSWQISATNLRDLESNCKAFVEGFESLYYKGEPSQMKVCKINGHSLLHLGILLSILRL